MTLAPFRLPLAIHHHRCKPVYLLLWLPYIGIYQLLNRFPLREPVELAFSPVDEAIPFVPELLPIYVAYLPLYWWSVARSENDREASRVFYGTHLQLFVSGFFFALFPVQMPREVFYSPEYYGWADVFWRWFDPPRNCFPSLHAANSLLLIQFNWSRPQRGIHTLALSAVIISTLLVKQHYFVDLLGAVGVYWAARWFLARLEISGVDSSGWSVRRERRGEASVRSRG